LGLDTDTLPTFDTISALRNNNFLLDITIINKALGQTFDRVGIYLPDLVFSQ